jgi:uncharacterized protein (TIGR02284 family)
MMLRQTTIRVYNALIRRGIDQCELYRRAASAVREPGLRTVLDENADQLGAVVADLQAQVRARGGDPAGHGTWRGALRRLLAQLGSRPARSDHAWIGCLRREESLLLHDFEWRLDHAPDEAVHVLNRQLPRLQGIHMDMCGLSRGMGG